MSWHNITSYAMIPFPSGIRYAIFHLTGRLFKFRGLTMNLLSIMPQQTSTEIRRTIISTEVLLA
jgi:hypothetical protein